MSSKDWLVLSIITFLTVAVWTVFDLYHTAITSTIAQPDAKLIEPFDPTLKTEVFETLQGRSE